MANSCPSWRQCGTSHILADGFVTRSFLLNLSTEGEKPPLYAFTEDNASPFPGIGGGGIILLFFWKGGGRRLHRFALKYDICEHFALMKRNRRALLASNTCQCDLAPAPRGEITTTASGRLQRPDSNGSWDEGFAQCQPLPRRLERGLSARSRSSSTLAGRQRHTGTLLQGRGFRQLRSHVRRRRYV